MGKNKMNKSIVPTDFTLSLVIVDAIPVIFFGLSMILVSAILSNYIFVAGAFLCLFAGVCKVIWKLIVVLKRKNIWWLFIQMRILMPIGMLIMISSLFIVESKIDYVTLWQMIVSFPQIIAFVMGVCCMALMIVFAFTLDSSNLKANWIEQLTNGFAQICFFVGLLEVLIKIKY